PPAHRLRSSSTTRTRTRKTPTGIRNSSPARSISRSVPPMPLESNVGAARAISQRFVLGGSLHSLEYVVTAEVVNPPEDPKPAPEHEQRSDQDRQPAMALGVPGDRVQAREAAINAE